MSGTAWVVDACQVRVPRGLTALPFWQATPGLRAWIVLCVLGALAASLRDPALGRNDGAVLIALPLLAAIEVELGRRAEGGRVAGQRPHKGLSAWAFAAALLCTSTLAALVTIPTYAYAWWRGLRVPLFKWVGSAAILSLAAAALQPFAPSLDDIGPLTAALVVAAAMAFLVLEAAGFGVCALVGEPQDEAWLRAQLRSRSFYVAELSVLSQAAVVAVLWSATPLLVLLLVPSYGVLQRALLHAPLREAAETDGKTGLLRLQTWQQRAGAVLETGRPFSVLLLDLDHFKRINDEHGHLIGDEVLSGCGEVLHAVLRPGDLPGRFGGEEFVVLLPDADAATAVVVAERLRCALASADFGGVRLTASIGVYASDPVPPDRLNEALACADLALYAAKAAGRDLVRTHRPVNSVPFPRTATPDRDAPVRPT